MNQFKTAAFLGTLLAMGAHAVPVLQLDIAGGSYDASTETITSSSKQFDLLALLNSSSTEGQYFLSMAVTPAINAAGSYGSFSFNGNTIDVTADMVYGTPPAEANIMHDGGDLGNHSIYPTYFFEYGFYFNSANTTSLYNVEDEAGRGLVGAGSLVYQSFALDMTNLGAGTGIHFDLYNESVRSGDIDADQFAPFSHDAEYIPGATVESVPEPSTLGLMGLGMFSLAMFARRRKA